MGCARWVPKIRNFRMIKNLAIFCITLVALVCSSGATAQTFRGTILGTVTSLRVNNWHGLTTTANYT